MLQPILVDIDNTIADFDGEFDKQWQKQHPDKPFISANNRITFHIEKSYPEELQPYVTDIFHEPGFFRSLEPIKGAVQALHDMDGKGYKIFLCTAPLTGMESCMTEKYNWVNEHLGKRWTRKMIATDDKTMIRGAVLIDDKPEITGMVDPEWKQVYFDKPYNRHKGGMRLIDWRFCEGLLLNYMGVNLPNKQSEMV